jgi:hypothetical protein
MVEVTNCTGHKQECTGYSEEHDTYLAAYIKVVEDEEVCYYCITCWIEWTNELNQKIEDLHDQIDERTP